jgi:hypothetical protein
MRRQEEGLDRQKPNADCDHDAETINARTNQLKTQRFAVDVDLVRHERCSSE